MRLLSWLRNRGGKTSQVPIRRELLSAQLELFRLARSNGVGVLTTHGDPARSSVLRRYKGLARVPIVQRLLCETMRMLGNGRTSAEIEVLIDAWIEIEVARAQVSSDDRCILRCIRDATLAFSHGLRPEQAMRIGRSRLESSDQLSTIDLTTLVRELQT